MTHMRLGLCRISPSVAVFMCGCALAGFLQALASLGDMSLDTLSARRCRRKRAISPDDLKQVRTATRAPEEEACDASAALLIDAAFDQLGVWSRVFWESFRSYRSCDQTPPNGVAGYLT